MLMGTQFFAVLQCARAAEKCVRHVVRYKRYGQKYSGRSTGSSTGYHCSRVHRLDPAHAALFHAPREVSCPLGFHI
jgi:hypothetical protein